MSCRLALLVLLIASAPRASESPDSLVHDKLLAPLEAREKGRSRYSRAEPPPAERRIRLLDAAPTTDGKGGAFVGFAVDARHGRVWQKSAITGCVYPEDGEVYVRFGKGFRPAGVLLGKKTPAAPSHVCHAAVAPES